MIVVGVDPDSVRHGLAIFSDGHLVALESRNLVEIRKWLDGCDKEIMFSIENVLANNFVYSRNVQASKASTAKVAIGIGRCQQAQEELMRELDDRQIPYVLHKPSGMNWAKDKARFERTTGWHGKSNEDTRSAAYFGWLEVKGGMK